MPAIFESLIPELRKGGACFLGLSLLLLGCLKGNMGEESEARRTLPSALTVSTDQSTYGPDEVISVTITNASDSSVTTYDQQSFCTIVTLEKESEDEWDPAANCTLNAPSKEVTLEPNADIVVALKPHPSQPSQEIVPGRYRATFMYTPGEHFRPTSPETDSVSSATFRVKK